MIDAPERIWSIGSEGPYRISCSILDHSDKPGCTEYVRADLVADKADAWDVISAKNAEIARLQEQVETLTRERTFWEDRENKAVIRAEAAEAERDRSAMMASERKVRAWALVDEDGNVIPSLCFASKEDADFAIYSLPDFEALASRIIPVEIRPIGDGE